MNKIMKKTQSSKLTNALEEIDVSERLNFGRFGNVICNFMPDFNLHNKDLKEIINKLWQIDCYLVHSVQHTNDKGNYNNCALYAYDANTNKLLLTITIYVNKKNYDGTQIKNNNEADLKKFENLLERFRNMCKEYLKANKKINFSQQHN